MKTYRATRHAPWAHYKTITATASALGNTERTAAHIPGDFYKIPEMMVFVEIRVSTNDKDTPLTGVLHLYGGRKNDDISHIGDVTLTTGLQVSSHDLYYVHQMVLTDKWIDEVHLADENGNNGMSRLVFDATGYDFLFGLITFSGSNKQWRIDISGFSG